MTDPQTQLSFDSFDTHEQPLTAPPKARAKAKARTQPPSPAVALPTPEPDAPTLAARLAQHPDYRVLRRLAPVLRFNRTAQGPVMRVLILDTETTGLDHGRDKIIELAMLRVDVDSATGLPVGEVVVFDELEDPGQPISKEVQALTGISGEMVQGKHLDEARIASLLQGVDLVIAHNAAFDRPFCEARIPAFAQLAWGCSFADIDWKQEGHGSAKLEYLALDKGWFYDAHRAETDCHALLAVLCEPLPSSQQSGLAKIMAASQGPSYRLQATQAPFEAKDALKSRAYRWNADQRVWHTRLDDEAQLSAECAWLKTHVYADRTARVHIEKMDARVKHSNRAGELSQREI